MFFRKDDRQQSILILFAINTYWGLTSVLMKHILWYMNSVTYLFLRFLCGAVVLIFLYHRPLRRQGRGLLWKGIILGLLLVAPMELTVLGLQYTSNTNSVFLLQFTVVVVPIITCAQYRMKPTKPLIISIAVIFLGIYVLVGGRFSAFGIGDIITIAAAILNAIAIVVAARFVKQEDPLLLGVIQVLFASVISGILWFLSVRSLPPMNSYVVMVLILTGIIGTGGCFVLRIVAQQTAPTFMVALLSLVNSIFGVVASALIAAPDGKVEALTANKLLGAVIMSVGILYYIIPTQKLKKKGT